MHQSLGSQSVKVCMHWSCKKSTYWLLLKSLMTIRSASQACLVTGNWRVCQPWQCVRVDRFRAFAPTRAPTRSPRGHKGRVGKPSWRGVWVFSSALPGKLNLLSITQPVNTRQPAHRVCQLFLCKLPIHLPLWVICFTCPMHVCPCMACEHLTSYISTPHARMWVQSIRRIANMTIILCDKRTMGTSSAM